MNSNTTMALLGAGLGVAGYQKMKKLGKEQQKAMEELAKSMSGPPQNLSKQAAPLERVGRKTIKPSRKRTGGPAQVEGSGLMTSSSGGKTKLGGY